jgi:hypothetical protein
MAVAWPGFLAACMLEVLVFAVVDPSELAWSGHALGWSRQAVYTAAFFVFWGVSALACALAILLRRRLAHRQARPAPRRALQGSLCSRHRPTHECAEYRRTG